MHEGCFNLKNTLRRVWEYLELVECIERGGKTRGSIGEKARIVFKQVIAKHKLDGERKANILGNEAHGVTLLCASNLSKEEHSSCSNGIAIAVCNGWYVRVIGKVRNSTCHFDIDERAVYIKRVGLQACDGEQIKIDGLGGSCECRVEYCTSD